MATHTATRADSDFPKSGGTYGNCFVAWGVKELTANPADSDLIDLCRVPKGAIVIGGYVMASDIEAGAGDELDIDLGWRANGDEIADPDGFGNFAAANWTGAAITGLVPVAGNWKPLQGVLLTAGPKTFNAETILGATVVTNAEDTGTGFITMVVFYTMQ